MADTEDAAASSAPSQPHPTLSAVAVPETVVAPLESAFDRALREETERLSAQELPTKVEEPLGDSEPPLSPEVDQEKDDTRCHPKLVLCE